MGLVYAEETYAIIGACLEVYRQQGTGFLESVYQECLAIEFSLRSIPFEREPLFGLVYKGRPLRQGYQPDFVCFGRVIVELKALAELGGKDRCQVHNYLKATDLRVGLLVNFGHWPKLQHERIIR